MRWTSAALAYLLLAESLPLRAQEPPPQVSRLNIVVVEGEGAINNVRQRTARAPIVQVEDQNRRPVAGAAVVFALPERGATGVFPNGSRTLTVMTDNQGRAVARGIRLNNVQGRMEIRVTASHQGQTASATIAQSNTLAAAAAGAASKGLLKWLLIAGGAGAAAAAGVAVANRGNNNGTTTTTRPPTTVSPGTGTVGRP